MDETAPATFKRPALNLYSHFLANLRAAWVADPDRNPIQFVQRR